MNLFRRTAALLLSALLAVDVAVIGAVHRHDHGSSAAASCHAHLHVPHGQSCTAGERAHQHDEQVPRHGSPEHDDDCVVCRHLMLHSLPAPAAAILPAHQAVEQAALASCEAPFAPLVSLQRTRAPPQSV